MIALYSISVSPAMRIARVSGAAEPAPGAGGPCFPLTTGEIAGRAAVDDGDPSDDSSLLLLLFADDSSDWM